MNSTREMAPDQISSQGEAIQPEIKVINPISNNISQQIHDDHKNIQPLKNCEAVKREKASRERSKFNNHFDPSMLKLIATLMLFVYNFYNIHLVMGEINSSPASNGDPPTSSLLTPLHTIPYSSLTSPYLYDGNKEEAYAQLSGRDSHFRVALNSNNFVNGGDYYLNDIWKSVDGGISWSLQTSAAQWRGRFGHSSLLFNNEIFVMGGSSEGYLNDIWSSGDIGKSWTKQSSNNQWSGRHGHTSFALNTTIFVMGGNNYYVNFNDIWSSVDRGVSWTLQTANAQFSVRWGHSSIVMNNSIFVIGGSSVGYLNDVWKSVDDGVSWTIQTDNAEWRGRYAHSSVVLNSGSIFVIGGNSYYATSSDYYMNDIWKSIDSGVSWMLKTANAQWNARWGHSSVVLNNNIFVIGGNSKIGLMNDCWSSFDGVSWTLKTSIAQWNGRNQHTNVVLNNNIYVIGGKSYYEFFNDVYITAYCLPGYYYFSNSSSCIACSGLPNGFYISRICDLHDIEFLPCSYPLQGQYVSNLCIYGNSTSEGENTKIDPCKNPLINQLVVNICKSGSSTSMGENTQISNCANPLGGQYVISACKAGNSASEGEDTQIASCTNPLGGHFVVSACIGGSPTFTGEDTLISSCANPLQGQYVSSACKVGNSTSKGEDTQIASCKNPLGGHFVVSACIGGTSTIMGEDTQISPCTAATNPSEGQYVSNLCITGDSSSKGGDFQIATCTKPSKGQYVSTLCISGTSTSIGKNCQIANCSNPLGGQYVNVTCKAGNSLIIGEDTQFSPCTSATNPVQGEYVASLCIPGNYKSKGKDFQVSSCSVTDELGYDLIISCFSGNSSSIGSNAVFSCSGGFAGSIVYSNNSTISGCNKCPFNEFSSNKNCCSSLNVLSISELNYIGSSLKFSTNLDTLNSLQEIMPLSHSSWNLNCLQSFPTSFSSSNVVIGSKFCGNNVTSSLANVEVQCSSSDAFMLISIPAFLTFSNASLVLHSPLGNPIFNSKGNISNFITGGTSLGWGYLLPPNSVLTIVNTSIDTKYDIFYDCISSNIAQNYNAWLQSCVSLSIPTSNFNLLPSCTGCNCCGANTLFFENGKCNLCASQATRDAAIILLGVGGLLLVVLMVGALLRYGSTFIVRYVSPLTVIQNFFQIALCIVSYGNQWSVNIKKTAASMKSIINFEMEGSLFNPKCYSSSLDMTILKLFLYGSLPFVIILIILVFHLLMKRSKKFYNLIVPLDKKKVISPLIDGQKRRLTKEKRNTQDNNNDASLPSTNPIHKLIVEKRISESSRESAISYKILFNPPTRFSICVHLLSAPLINIGCYLLILAYPMILRNSLTYFDCRLQPDNSYLLASDEKFSCFQSSWMSYLSLIVFQIFIYVFGIPYFLWSVLFSIRSSYAEEKLYTPGATLTSFYSYCGYLSQRFHPSQFYYAFVLLLRQNCITIVEIFLPEFYSLQILCIGVVLFISGLVHLRFVPFRTPELNRLEAVLIAIALIECVAALILESANPAVFQGDSLEQAIQVGVSNCTFYGAICGGAIYSIYTWWLTLRRADKATGDGYSNAAERGVGHLYLRRLYVLYFILIFLITMLFLLCNVLYKEESSFVFLFSSSVSTFLVFVFLFLLLRSFLKSEIGNLSTNYKTVIATGEKLMSTTNKDIYMKRKQNILKSIYNEIDNCSWPRLSKEKVKEFRYYIIPLVKEYNFQIDIGIACALEFDLVLIKFLLDRGDEKDKSINLHIKGFPPLFYALYREDASLFEFLLENGAGVFYKDKFERHIFQFMMSLPKLPLEFILKAFKLMNFTICFSLTNLIFKGLNSDDILELCDSVLEIIENLSLENFEIDTTSAIQIKGVYSEKEMQLLPLRLFIFNCFMNLSEIDKEYFSNTLLPIFQDNTVESIKYCMLKLIYDEIEKSTLPELSKEKIKEFRYYFIPLVKEYNFQIDIEIACALEFDLVLIKLLLDRSDEKDKSINSYTKGFPSLFYALYREDLSLFEFLIENGASVIQEDKFKRNIFQFMFSRPNLPLEFISDVFKSMNRINSLSKTNFIFRQLNFNEVPRLCESVLKIIENLGIEVVPIDKIQNKDAKDEKEELLLPLRQFVFNYLIFLFDFENKKLASNFLPILNEDLIHNIKCYIYPLVKEHNFQIDLDVACAIKFDIEDIKFLSVKYEYMKNKIRFSKSSFPPIFYAICYEDLDLFNLLIENIADITQIRDKFKRNLFQFIIKFNSSFSTKFVKEVLSKIIVYMRKLDFDSWNDMEDLILLESQKEGRSAEVEKEEFMKSLTKICNDSGLTEYYSISINDEIVEFSIDPIISSYFDGEKYGARINFIKYSAAMEDYVGDFYYLAQESLSVLNKISIGDYIVTVNSINVSSYPRDIINEMLVNKSRPLNVTFINQYSILKEVLDTLIPSDLFYTLIFEGLVPISFEALNCNSGEYYGAKVSNETKNFQSIIISKGDIVSLVNGLSVIGKSFDKIMELVSSKNSLIITITFQKSK